MAEIQRVSIKHEAIMDYIMAFPTVKLGDVAKHFGVTQPWLSQIIHSDAFQEMYKGKAESAFSHTVLSLREKMETAAHIAMDRLLETLPFETEVSTISDVGESMLDRLGFSPKSPAAAPGAGGILWFKSTCT